MKNVTLKFFSVSQMLEFIRLSCIGNYEMSTTTKSLTACLSKEQISLAGLLSATITVNSIPLPS